MTSQSRLEQWLAVASEQMDEVDEFTFDVFVEGLIGVKLFDSGWAPWGPDRWKKQLWARTASNLDGDPVAMRMTVERKAVEGFRDEVARFFPVEVRHFILREKG